jgi:hypothetical protein
MIEKRRSENDLNKIESVEDDRIRSKCHIYFKQ